jgi:hypothetical protein
MGREEHLEAAVAAEQCAVRAVLGALATARQPPDRHVTTAIRVATSGAPLRMHLDPDVVETTRPPDPT